MTKVLITGGAGFIGSHIAQALQGQAEVRILDNFRTGSRANLVNPGAMLIEGSILDPAVVRKAVEGVDWVFHLAALVSVPESVLNPDDCTALNVTGFMNVLEASARSGVSKVCFSSSAAIYGDNPIVPKTEDMTPEPKSPYASTKLEGERLCRSYTATRSLPTVSLRYFTLGADGNIHYLTAAEITELAPKKARRTKGSWVDTDYSEAFTYMEFRFRRAGDANAPVITHRHFSADLSNSKVVGSPLEKYLLARGPLVAMTKAASYLLWNSNFSGIRDFLLGHMRFMVSDSTGIPPRFAKKAGFTQTTFGRFTGPYLDADPEVSDAFVKLWAGQKSQKLPFRYGYPDIAGNVHMMITAPSSSTTVSK